MRMVADAEVTPNANMATQSNGLRIGIIRPRDRCPAYVPFGTDAKMRGGVSRITR
jgi:hypothetical protein